MWVLLLPLGLGPALLPPGPLALAPRRGPAEPSAGHSDTSGGCELCHSPHRGRAQANGTRGASVTLGCPVAGAPLGRLRAVHWHFWGGPAGAGATVCSQSRGRPRCGPPYGHRATLPAPHGPPGVLLLRGLRDGDAGTYTCLLLGEDDCACGEVTLLLLGGAPCSPPCSGAPPNSGFGLGLLLLLLLLLLLPPARGLSHRGGDTSGDKLLPRQHPGGGSTQSLPRIVSPTMAVPRAPAASTPPRPLSPFRRDTGTEGQRDTGTGGHGAPGWQVLKAAQGDADGRGAAVRGQRPGPAPGRHRHPLLAAAPGARWHRQPRAVARLPRGALPPPARHPRLMGGHAGADAALGAHRRRRPRPGALRCGQRCPAGACPRGRHHPAPGWSAGAAGVHGRHAEPPGAGPHRLALLLVLHPGLGRCRPHQLGRAFPPLCRRQGPVSRELRSGGCLRGPGRLGGGPSPALAPTVLPTGVGWGCAGVWVAAVLSCAQSLLC